MHQLFNGHKTLFVVLLGGRKDHPTYSAGAQDQKMRSTEQRQSYTVTSVSQWCFRCDGRGDVSLWAASDQPVRQKVRNQRSGWSLWSQVTWVTAEGK